MTSNARNTINAMRNVDTHVINKEVTCVAHTLQLSVMDALKREDVDDIFSKAEKWSLILSTQISPPLPWN